jgi:hypothetical protein
MVEPALWVLVLGCAVYTMKIAIQIPKPWLVNDDENLTDVDSSSTVSISNVKPYKHTLVSVVTCDELTCAHFKL